jgi:hypothetical protein
MVVFFGWGMCVRVQTLRGTGANNIVILEEAAFMNPEVIFKIVLPTLARSSAALLGITTLDDVFSFWTKMMQQKDELGKPVFKTLRYTLVCDECKAKGEENECEHKIGDLPHWQSARKHDKLRALMQDNEEIFMAESRHALLPSFPFPPSCCCCCCLLSMVRAQGLRHGPAGHAGLQQAERGGAGRAAALCQGAQLSLRLCRDRSGGRREAL